MKDDYICIFIYDVFEKIPQKRKRSSSRFSWHMLIDEVLKLITKNHKQIIFEAILDSWCSRTSDSSE